MITISSTSPGNFLPARKQFSLNKLSLTAISGTITETPSTSAFFATRFRGNCDISTPNATIWRTGTEMSKSPTTVTRAGGPWYEAPSHSKRIMLIERHFRRLWSSAWRPITWSVSTKACRMWNSTRTLTSWCSGLHEESNGLCLSSATNQNARKWTGFNYENASC